MNRLQETMSVFSDDDASVNLYSNNAYIGNRLSFETKSADIAKFVLNKFEDVSDKLATVSSNYYISTSTPITRPITTEKSHSLVIESDCLEDDGEGDSVNSSSSEDVNFGRDYIESKDGHKALDNPAIEFRGNANNFHDSGPYRSTRLNQSNNNLASLRPNSYDVHLPLNESKIIPTESMTSAIKSVIGVPKKVDEKTLFSSSLKRFDDLARGIVNTPASSAVSTVARKDVMFKKKIRRDILVACKTCGYTDDHIFDEAQFGELLAHLGVSIRHSDFAVGLL